MPLGGLAPLPFPLGGTVLDGWTAEQHARVCADLKAVVQTVPFAVLHAGTASEEPLAYLGQHGVGILAAPVLKIIGVGEIRASWEPSYLDAYDNAYATHIKHAVAIGHEPSGGPYVQRVIVTVEIVSVRQIVVHANTPFGPAEGVFSLVVW